MIWWMLLSAAGGALGLWGAGRLQRRLHVKFGPARTRQPAKGFIGRIADGEDAGQLVVISLDGRAAAVFRLVDGHKPDVPITVNGGQLEGLDGEQRLGVLVQFSPPKVEP